MSLQPLLEKEIHDLYRDKYPKIYDFVKLGLAKGETPKTIQNFLKTKTNDKLQSYHVGLVASYLLKHQN